MTPTEAFAVGDGAVGEAVNPVNAIWISLGSIPDGRRSQAGLQRLSALLAQRPEGFGRVVV